MYLGRCQNLFINEVVESGQHKNIAKNKALKENVFMMIVCIQNRIPLFLVGKPGSSKSLSKAMVVDAMKGKQSEKDMFKRMKQVCKFAILYFFSSLWTINNIHGFLKILKKRQKRQMSGKALMTLV